MGEGFFTGVVHGVVMAGDAPVEGAAVMIYHPGPCSGGEWSSPMDSTVTGTDGRYWVEAAVFGGGEGCGTHCVPLQVIPAEPDRFDTLRIADLEVELCMHGNSATYRTLRLQSR